MSTPLHVEVVQSINSLISVDEIKLLVSSYLTNFQNITPGITINRDEFENENLKKHVESIYFCDMDHTINVSMIGTELIYHVHKLHNTGGELETVEICHGSSIESVPVATLWPLPSRQLCGLWHSLIYDTSVKEDTMRYVETAFFLSFYRLDPELVTCNRVVLLHGPPGTGKTSLCRALAHKLAVRMSESYPRAVLFEVNAHGLFSKWFSESGKLVGRMFSSVRELLEDSEMLVIVLVDEVESLTAARRGVISNGDPSDALRVVNAVLTQLDTLKQFKNALVLTTSNMTDAIDPAFVDRADVKRHIGPPGECTAYAMLRSSTEELMRAGVVVPQELLFPLRLVGLCNEADTIRASLKLQDVARAAVNAGMSGRALRRLPLLALIPARNKTYSLGEFLEALQQAIRHHKADTKLLSNN